MSYKGACGLCGLVGNVGAELVKDGIGFRCANERRCQARQDGVPAKLQAELAEAED